MHVGRRVHAPTYPIGVVNVCDVGGPGRRPWRRPGGDAILLDAASRRLRGLRGLNAGEPLTSNPQLDTQVAGHTTFALAQGCVRRSRRNESGCAYTMLFLSTRETG